MNIAKFSGSWSLNANSMLENRSDEYLKQVQQEFQKREADIAALPKSVELSFKSVPFDLYPVDTQGRKRDIVTISLKTKPTQANAGDTITTEISQQFTSPKKRSITRNVLESYFSWLGYKIPLEWEPLPKFIDRVVKEAGALAQKHDAAN